MVGNLVIIHKERDKRKGTYMTTKQRAYLKGLAMNIEPIMQIGKSNLTPELVKAIDETFFRRELIKLSILQNASDDPREMASIIAERTHSEVVQIIGKKIVLYKPFKEVEKRKIILPKAQNLQKE